MVNANDFHRQTDSDTLQSAIQNRGADGIVLIPPRAGQEDPERSYWLLDRAILLPENTTVILQNCTIKLSDRCRDNFFRTANCGMGINEPEPIRNIHLQGEGLCVLQGADHPRATGDGGKILACPCPYEPEDLCRLADWVPADRKAACAPDFGDLHSHSYGTDAGKEDQSPLGDWRGIGILFANTENFSIRNLKIVESHGWGISLEACSFGSVEKVEFDACMSKVIDGMRQNMENQDGVDIRNGCHHITIANISGQTGDDMVALTAVALDEFVPGGALCSTHVMNSDWSKRDRDIHDIIIRNVIGYSHLCYNVRLLACNTHIYNIVIDGVVDTSPPEIRHFGGILLGEGDSAYGKNLPDGLSAITVSNVICNSIDAIVVGGYLKDSAITNVINRNPDCPVIRVDRQNGLNNVLMANLVSVGAQMISQPE
ncbi:MAG: hypothetical protein IJY82_00490 [Oscillospiraceae bacterium]|nr:hypothetical protein [Oscillospiraceae bacterium]